MLVRFVSPFGSIMYAFLLAKIPVSAASIRAYDGIIKGCFFIGNQVPPLKGKEPNPSMTWLFGGGGVQYCPNPTEEPEAYREGEFKATTTLSVSCHVIGNQIWLSFNIRHIIRMYEWGMRKQSPPHPRSNSELRVKQWVLYGKVGILDQFEWICP